MFVFAFVFQLSALSPFRQWGCTRRAGRESRNFQEASSNPFALPEDSKALPKFVILKLVGS